MGRISINMDSLKTSRDWKRFKLQDGENVYRVLPPFGDAEIHKNFPYRKWTIVWMTDPVTGRRRAYASPKTDSNDAKDPVSEYLELLVAKIDAFKKKFAEKGLSEEQIKEKLAPLTKVSWDMRIQHLFAYNAANKSGEVGLLEVKSTAHKGIKKKFSQYIKEYAQDPTSLNSDEDDSGVWLNIDKSGIGKNTEYVVDLNCIREKRDGRVIKEDDRTPLAENIRKNYDDLGYDLNSIYQRKTYDEMREILLWNLAVIAQETPAAMVPQFDVSGIKVELKTKETMKDDLADTAEEVDVPQEKPKSKPQVKLNLGDVDLEDETPIVVTKTTAPIKTQTKEPEIVSKSTNVPAPSKKPVNVNPNDDIFALADSILND